VLERHAFGKPGGASGIHQNGHIIVTDVSEYLIRRSGSQHILIIVHTFDLAIERNETRL